MVEDIKSDETLDARGLSCPMPILKTKKMINTMASGQVLEVFSTDPGTGNDLPSFAKRGGHEYLGSQEDQGYTRYYIRKG